MSSAKATAEAPPVQVIEDDDSVQVFLAGAGIGLRLSPIRYDSLTLGTALELPARKDVIVRFRRASADAKRLLRERHVAYASDDGEVFVVDPPVAIHQEARRRKPADVAGAEQRAPFATKASRVSRWLLNHPAERFNIRELARHTEL